MGCLDFFERTLSHLRSRLGSPPKNDSVSFYDQVAGCHRRDDFFVSSVLHCRHHTTTVEG